ncbi:MAG TPA: hypothetical protein VGM22_12310 [Methylomirabilota bacterium]|jgi:hypothetical protein
MLSHAPESCQAVDLLGYAAQEMSGAQQCLIIVPRHEPELYERLREHFAADTRVFIRMDSRTGERTSRRTEIFAVGGGDLDPELRTFVDEQLRLLRRPSRS